MKAIVCCKCAGAPQYCKSSFSSQFPDEPLPPLYIKEKAKDLLTSVPDTSELYAQVSQILRRKGRYGFYFEYAEDGHVLDCWNLLRHRRVE